MGRSRLVPLAMVAALGVISREARAEGVCVAIDTARDTLAVDERAAVLVAITTALEREGVAVAPDPARCAGTVVAYNVRLTKAVTTTIAAGPRSVTGKASSIDELDLLVRQLVRSLVTGRAFATGTGVQDRENVLRDQTAPLRADPSATREWIPTLGIGGGMLQLPPIEGRPRHRQYNIVAIDLREWTYLNNPRNALEVRARIVIHDYSVFGAAWDAYEDVPDDPEHSREQVGRAFALMFSPFGAADWEVGVGFATHLGDATPRPYLRAGAAVSLLCRFSDDDHYFDLGVGAYAGIGLQLTKHTALSIEANIARPVVHDIVDSGYRYFLTTTAMLEVRGERRQRKVSLFAPEPVPTVRRINE